MSIYKLKPAFQAMLRPTIRFLLQCKLTPNAITMTALLGSILMGVLIALYPGEQAVFIALPLFLLIRMALNAIDGMMAREHNLCSNHGVFMNEFGDIVSDTALYLSFALVPGFSPILVIVFVILSIFTEVAGIISCQIGASRRYDGPLGKSDRAFIFGVLALLIALNIQIQPYVYWVLCVMIALTILTIFNRIKQALNEREAV